MKIKLKCVISNNEKKTHRLPRIKGTTLISNSINYINKNNKFREPSKKNICGHIGPFDYILDVPRIDALSFFVTFFLAISL